MFASEITLALCQDDSPHHLWTHSWKNTNAILTLSSQPILNYSIYRSYHLYRIICYIKHIELLSQPVSDLLHVQREDTAANQIQLDAYSTQLQLNTRTNTAIFTTKLTLFFCMTLNSFDILLVLLIYKCSTSQKYQ